MPAGVPGTCTGRRVYTSVPPEVSGRAAREPRARALPPACGASRWCSTRAWASRSGPTHSYAALAALPELAALGRPLLVGPSRKSFLTAAIGERAPAERDMATAASVAAAVLLGAHIVRVHNVRAMVDVGDESLTRFDVGRSC